MSTGKSIHIGLNRVDPACYGGWNGALAGCINDATAMQDIADSLGYSSSLLTDADATAGAVIEAISRAASELSSGDILFLTYSGHGGQVDDANGDEDEGQDETWVLYDRQVVDDELYQLYSQFADGVRVVILSDSCHSGTVAKVRTAGAYRTRVRDVPGENAPAADEKPRNLPLEVQAADQERQRALYETVQFLSGAKSDADDPRERAAHLGLPGQPALLRRARPRALHGGAADDVRRRRVRRRLRRVPPLDPAADASRPVAEPVHDRHAVVGLRGPDAVHHRGARRRRAARPRPDPDPCRSPARRSRRGDSGEHVEHLQERLVAHGHDVDIDGYFGPQVTAAVQAFQRAEGLTADGIVGPATWSCLEATPAGGAVEPDPEPLPDPESEPEPANRPTLRVGDKGEDVKDLQVLLRDQGYSLVADGNFGPFTASVVRQFQTACGLVADGVCGPATWAALESQPAVL